MRLLASAAGLGLMLALPAAAQEERPTFSSIAVEADVTAVANAPAAPYWRELGPDLEAAITAELVGSLDPGGKQLVVSVTEIALADEFSATFGPEDARIVGRVDIFDQSQYSETAYEISATAIQAAGFLASEEEIITISPTSETFYRAVVSAFARGVAETVRGGS